MALQGLEFGTEYEQDDAAGRLLYDLIGACDHSGSLWGGHYTARCRSATDGVWHEFNDEMVGRCAPVNGPSTTAYVLFYRRRGPL
jgi:ubiquitin C-terminal hydrolase